MRPACLSPQSQCRCTVGHVVQHTCKGGYWPGWHSAGCHEVHATAVHPGRHQGISTVAAPEQQPWLSGLHLVLSVNCMECCTSLLTGQLNAGALLPSILRYMIHQTLSSGRNFMQMERTHFIRKVDPWICAMREVAIPAWACLSAHEESPGLSDRSDSPFSIQSSRSDAFCYSARLPSRNLWPRPGITASESQKCLSASWSPRRIVSVCNRGREAAIQLAGSDLASQLKSFQSWVQASIAARDSAHTTSCFEVFQRYSPTFLLLEQSPNLRSHPFHSVL